MVMSESIEKLIERYEIQQEEHEDEILGLKEELRRAQWWGRHVNYFQPRYFECDKNLSCPRLEIHLVTHNDFCKEWTGLYVFRSLLDSILDRGTNKFTGAPFSGVESHSNKSLPELDTVSNALKAIPDGFCGEARFYSREWGLPLFLRIHNSVIELPSLDIRRGKNERI